MRSLNEVNLIGFLGKDPESFRAKGSDVARLSIATDESYTPDGARERVEKTEWHRVTFFGKSAQIIADYARKGSRVFVRARLETSRYEKDGETVYSVDLVGRDFLLLDRKPEDAAAAGKRGR